MAKKQDSEAYKRQHQVWKYRCPKCGTGAVMTQYDFRPHVNPVEFELNTPRRTRVCDNGHETRTFEIDEIELSRLRRNSYRFEQLEAWHFNNEE